MDDAILDQSEKYLPRHFAVIARSAFLKNETPGRSAVQVSVPPWVRVQQRQMHT